MHPIATNLQISFSGIDVYDIEPETLPNLYHGMPVTLYGRYKGQGSAKVDITAEVNGRQTSTTLEMDFPSQNKENPEIERMWAWHRMERLKRMHEMNSNQELVDEIVRLGEGFSITSEYTSFLVLENDDEYRRWKIERHNAVRIERDRAAQQRLRQELQVLRSQAMDAIGPVDENSIARNTLLPIPIQTPGIPSTDVILPTPLQEQAHPSRSFNMPQFSGGGAMDPVSALVGVALAGGAFWRRRKKK